MIVYLTTCFTKNLKNILKDSSSIIKNDDFCNLLGGLVSYAVLNEKEFKRILTVFRNVFVDSGAFTFHRFPEDKKKKKGIEGYINFICKNQIKIYSNYDVLGDAKKTLINQKIMETYGLNPLPCYHYGDNVKYLKYYLDRYDYISLGGLVIKDRRGLVNWMDDLFLKNIVDSQGNPRWKIHGFGIGSYFLMLRYPWYSVDTTKALLIASKGRIIVNRGINLDNYFQKPVVISIGVRTPKNYATSSDFIKNILNQYFDLYKIPIGKTIWVDKKEKILVAGITNQRDYRLFANIIYFYGFVKKFESIKQRRKNPLRKSLRIKGL